MDGNNRFILNLERTVCLLTGSRQRLAALARNISRPSWLCLDACHHRFPNELVICCLTVWCFRFFNIAAQCHGVMLAAMGLYSQTNTSLSKPSRKYSIWCSALLSCFTSIYTQFQWLRFHKLPFLKKQDWCSKHCVIKSNRLHQFYFSCTSEIPEDWQFT